MNLPLTLQVRQICHIALKRDHEFINTVEEGSEETHAQVGLGYFLEFLGLIPLLDLTWFSNTLEIFRFSRCIWFLL